MAISGTQSWKTFSNISDPTWLSDPVASFLILGLSSTSSYVTAIRVGDGTLFFSAFLDCVLCVQCLWMQKGAVPTGHVGNRLLFVAEALAKCVQLRSI